MAALQCVYFQYGSALSTVSLILKSTFQSGNFNLKLQWFTTIYIYTVQRYTHLPFARSTIKFHKVNEKEMFVD